MRENAGTAANGARAAAYCSGAHHDGQLHSDLDEPKPQAQERLADLIM
jgi:hypothetical protein